MTNEFATAAYRFGHSMIPALLQRFNTDNSGLYDEYLLHNVFRNSSFLKSDSGLGFEQILMGLVVQASEECDKEFTTETTNLLFAAKGANFGEDLAARNIQRYGTSVQCILWYFQSGAPLERVQRVQLHPLIFRKPHLHPSIFQNSQKKRKSYSH